MRQTAALRPSPIFNSLCASAVSNSTRGVLRIDSERSATALHSDALGVPPSQHQVVKYDGMPREPDHIDVVYATRIQRGQLLGEQIDGYIHDFHVNTAVVDHLGDSSTIVMHPLPRYSTPSSNDLSTDLDADPRLAIFRRSDRGITIRMALVAPILGDADSIESAYRDPLWHTTT